MLESLVKHLHGFVADVELTSQEWERAIAFLTRTGQMSVGGRQEFILLSDVLGVSMLVETINHREYRCHDGVDRHRARSMCSRRRLVHSATPSRWPGRRRSVPCHRPIVDEQGKPIQHAVVDVWQADADGFYDVQREGEVPEFNLRGLFTPDSTGEFWFRTIVPRHYPIPDDGPVGDLLKATVPPPEPARAYPLHRRGAGISSRSPRTCS